ncbi:MAG: hypothetical protein ACR2LK_04735 [Solirubrobacteraceae bacterium]
MTTPAIADRQYTIEFYLDRSARDALPLDRRFVQARIGNNRPAPGPLSQFVTRAREASLEQYLLAHAFASSATEGDYDVRLPGTAWARAIGGHFDHATGKVENAALHLVSRNWRFLEDLKLIERERRNRRVRITLLADDGSGNAYVRPGAGRLGKKLVDGEPGYLQLPYAYWRDRWHEKLDLASKAMLLVALPLGNGFQLPYARVPGWYGFSASTAERGLRDLHNHGLLHREKLRRPDPESPVGYADVYYYELEPPFGPRKVMSRSVHRDWVGPPKPKAPIKRRPKRPASKSRTPKATSRVLKGAA